MEEVKIKNLYNLNETIAAKVFEGVTYPWEVLPKISDFIIQLGNTLDLNDYDKIEDNIWIAQLEKPSGSAGFMKPLVDLVNISPARALDDFHIIALMKH